MTLLLEMESSRTHFEVLSLKSQVLGLEASSPRKLPCSLFEDSARDVHSRIINPSETGSKIEPIPNYEIGIAKIC